MIAASSRVLMACSTAPVIGTPKCASSIGGVLGSMTLTVSPGPMPHCVRAEAQAPCARVELGIGVAGSAVDDRGVVGIDGRGTLQQRERCQRLEVGGGPIEVFRILIV